jgi:hypothetical protein
MMIHLILVFLGLSRPPLCMHSRESRQRNHANLGCFLPQQDLNSASLSCVQGRALIAQALESLRNLRSRLRDSADATSLLP